MKFATRPEDRELVGTDPLFGLFDVCYDTRMRRFCEVQRLSGPIVHGTPEWGYHVDGFGSMTWGAYESELVPVEAPV